MFPSKLYEIQLSPSQDAFFNSQLFKEHFDLNEPNNFEQILLVNNKILNHKNFLSLRECLKYSFQKYLKQNEDFNSRLRFQIQQLQQNKQLNYERISSLLNTDFFLMDDTQILQLCSLTFETKIIIYTVVDDQLTSKIINYRFKNRIMLAENLGGYYQIFDTKEQNQSFQKIDECADLEQQIDLLISPQKMEKNSLQNSDHKQQDIQMREQLIDEVNKDCEMILQECFRVIEDSSHNSTKSDGFDDAPTTPPRNFSQNFQAHLDSSNTNITSNEILASISPHKVQEKQNDTRYQGKLKFFDEGKSYGFIIMDSDGSDIFVHSDDLFKTGVTKDYLKTVKQGNIIRFSFSCLQYVGKYNKSRKAVDLRLIAQQNIQPQYYTYPYAEHFYQQQYYNNYNYAQ